MGNMRVRREGGREGGIIRVEQVSMNIYAFKYCSDAFCGHIISKSFNSGPECHLP